MAVETLEDRAGVQVPIDHAVVEARGQRAAAVGRDRNPFDRPAVLVERRRTGSQGRRKLQEKDHRQERRD